MCDGQPYPFLVAHEENEMVANKTTAIIFNVFFFILLYLIIIPLQMYIFFSKTNK